MASNQSLVIVLLSVILVASMAAPSPKKDSLEPKEDLQTDSSIGFGYAAPVLAYGGYYPYYGYSVGYGLGYGYGYGYPRYYGYGAYPYYYL